MIDVTAIRENLCHAFCRDVGVTAVDQNVASIALPMTGRDGVHIMAYASQSSGGWRISDMGSTLMRLSYENDLAKLLIGARAKLFDTVLKESGISEDDGELFLNVPADALPFGLFTLGQGVTRIEDLGLWTRGRVETAFYDDLRQIVSDVVPRDKIIENYAVPGISNSADYPVDYFVDTGARPLYLFGVLNRDKARLATIILQHLSRHASPFESMIVYADMDEIPRQDVARLLVAANDVVPSISEKDAIEQKIRHRMAA